LQATFWQFQAAGNGGCFLLFCTNRTVTNSSKEKQVKKFLIAAIMLAFGVASASAQSLEDLNLQIHGYATQGFLYTTQNNILTTESSGGSPSWSEAVVNVSTQPIPKLRVGVQARYFLLGNLGNTISLDWASADYKVDDRFGVRFGKVKTPSSLFNETQDIDPSYIWSLLPQGIYPLVSRNSLLAHYGGVVYGTLSLGDRFGKLEYRGWGGERVIGSSDGYLLGDAEKGINAPNGLSGTTYGAGLRWKTPVRGLSIGSALAENNTKHGTINEMGTNGTYTGTLVRTGFFSPDFYAQYEKNRVMVAAEYARKPYSEIITLTTGPSPIPTTPTVTTDQRLWYAMASYRVTDKLTGGIYQSQYFNRAAALGPGRFSKDWAISARYDFNQFVYAKAEQHFIDGTAVGYDKTLNPKGLKPDTRLTILKIGVSF
jgi:hypothetical protein